MVPIGANGLGLYTLLTYVADPRIGQATSLDNRTAALSDALSAAMRSPLQDAPERHDLQLGLNRLPARVRFQAFNSSKTRECVGIRTNELGLVANSERTVTLAPANGPPMTAAMWVTRAADDETARLMFMVEAMFAGVEASQCAGFPPTGVSDGDGASLVLPAVAGAPPDLDDVGLWTPSATAPRFVVAARRGSLVAALLIVGVSVPVSADQQQSLVSATAAAVAEG